MAGKKHSYSRRKKASFAKRFCLVWKLKSLWRVLKDLSIKVAA